MPGRGDLLKTTFDEYTIQSPLGGGGAGEVFRAVSSDGRSVAIKVLRTNQPSLKHKRFQNELSFCAKEVHPNIIKVMDHGILSAAGGDQPFYVMPIYETTLRKFNMQQISSLQRLELFSKIMDGVEAAHLRGITHRDLKPENILFSADAQSIVVADFEIAHFEEDELAVSVETRTQERLASWEYAAPEQRRPGQPIDLRADIYSLGLILHEMFTGQVPHGADPISIGAVDTDFSYLDEVTSSMRQNAPDRRPRDIASIKSVLIARRNDFIQQQRIDELRGTVVPASETSDILIDDPIRPVGLDYENGNIVFDLSRQPNRQWVNLFVNPADHQALIGSEPVRFSFNDHYARVPVREESAQLVVDLMKTYVTQTNNRYAAEVRSKAAAEERRRRQALEESLAKELREQEVRERLRSMLRL